MPCEISLLSHSLLWFLLIHCCGVEIQTAWLEILSQLEWVIFNSAVSKQIIKVRSDIQQHWSWVNRGLTSCTQLTSPHSSALCCLHLPPPPNLPRYSSILFHFSSLWQVLHVSPTDNQVFDRSLLTHTEQKWNRVIQVFLYLFCCGCPDGSKQCKSHNTNT